MGWDNHKQVFVAILNDAYSFTKETIRLELDAIKTKTEVKEDASDMSSVDEDSADEEGFFKWFGRVFYEFLKSALACLLPHLWPHRHGLPLPPHMPRDAHGGVHHDPEFTAKERSFEIVIGHGRQVWLQSEAGEIRGRDEAAGRGGGALCRCAAARGV